MSETTQEAPEVEVKKKPEAVEAAPELTVADLKAAMAEVAEMKAQMQEQAGMNIPVPTLSAHAFNPGYDYEAPDFDGIYKMVGKEFGDTLKAFAKLKKMSKEEMEKWACKSWCHIMHMQEYNEDRAIIKYKTWIRNLRNVQLSL